MRKIKKLILIFIVLALLAGGGLVALVMMSFNPEAYQKQVMASIRELTGRELTVGGPTVMTWSPMPTVVMQKVKISNQNQSDEKTMLSVDRVQIQIEWASLLKSPLVVKSVELTNPVLLLERLESNRANFALPFLVDPDRQLPDADFLSGASGAATKIDEISIQNGTVRYVNHITDNQIQVEKVTGELAVDSLRGPFRFQGKGLIYNNELTLSATSGVFKTATPVDISLKLTEPQSQFSLDMSGKLTPDAIDKWFSGIGTFTVQKPNLVLDMAGLPRLDAVLDKPTVGNLTAELTPTKDILKEFTVRFGDGEKATAVTGTVIRSSAGAVQDWHISVGMNEFNPAVWQNYRALLNWDLLAADKKYPHMTLQAKVQSVPYLKGEIQNVDVSARYEAGKLKINQFSATLPGRTAVKATGASEVRAGRPTLELSMQATSDSVKTLGTWLFPDNAVIRDTKMLQRGNAVGRITVSDDKTSVTFQELKIDEATLSGTVTKTGGKAAGYDAQVQVVGLNGDAYTGWQASEQPTDLAALPWQIKSAFEKATYLADVRANVSLDMNDTTWFGMPISKAQLKANMDKGVLKIDTLSLQNIATANLSVQGLLEGVGRPQMNVGNLTVQVDTKQLPLLLKRANIGTKWALIEQAAETKVTLSAAGGRDGTWQVSALGNVGETSLRLGGQLSALETTPTVNNFDVDIAYPNFQTFAGFMWPDKKVLPQLEGALKVKAVLTGSAKHLEIKDGLLGIGLHRITGTVIYDHKNRKTIQAELASPSLDMGKIMPEEMVWYTSAGGFSDKPFAWGFLTDWEGSVKLKANQLLIRNMDIRNATVEIAAKDKKLTLTKLDGVSGTGTKSPIQAKGTLDWSGTPKLDAAFFIKDLPLRTDFLVLKDIALGNGLMSIEGTVKAEGSTPLAMSQHLFGAGKIGIQNAQLIGVQIAPLVPVVTRALQKGESPDMFEPQMQRILTSGKTPVNAIFGAFSLSDGVMRMMDLTVKMPDAEANPTQVIWDMPKQTMDISIPVTLTPLSHLPPVVLGISVNKGQSRYQPSFSDLSKEISYRVKTNQTEKQAVQEKQQQKKVVETRAEREAEAAELTEMARIIVSNMEIQLKQYPNDNADQVLQAAKDALAIVNQLAVREEPTDAQLIQQIEQARIVMIKQSEFQAIMEQETLMATQGKMDAYRREAQKLLQETEGWSAQKPDVVALRQLADNARQNGALLEKANQLLGQGRSDAEVAQIMKAAETALARIKEVHARAAQFDMTVAAPVPAEPAEPVLSGAIGRAN